MSKNICKKHHQEFAEIVECNDCNMLEGYMLKSTQGAIFQMPNKPNIWSTKEDANEFAHLYGLGKSWKPIYVYIHFD